MKIMVAMSGGIDSSMSVKLLKDAGHELMGVYMKLHENPSYHAKNIANVQKVGEYFGVPTSVLDLSDEFAKNVYEPFVDAYKKGLTPNPCALCNRFIKLGALLNYAKENDCEKLATGHYVRIENGLLKVALDESKDQSYFLANIEPSALKSVIFPLGGYLKSQIKEMAKAHEKINFLSSQKESNEICFVENTYIDVLERHFSTLQKGVVKNQSGDVVGTHDGYMRYTIGKRRGFSVFGAHEPHYVTKIDPQNNEIYVGLKEELAQNSFKTINFNAFCELEDEFECYAKIRYRSPKTKAFVSVKNGFCEARLAQNAYGIAKGQLAVFYDEFDRVIASGFIG